MVETKHTPGPWKWATIGDYAYVIGKPEWPCRSNGIKVPEAGGSSAKMSSGRNSIMTDSKLVRLEDCPPGLFRFGKTIGFRSEYSSVTPANPNQPDAYVVASGEYFWGGCTTTEDRSDVMVEPIDIDTLSASSPPVGGSGEPTEPVVWTNLHHLRRYLRGETETLCVIREREREWNMALRLSQSDLQFVPSELRKEMK